MIDASYRVIVVGGGHAGAEASWAAANMLPASRHGPRTIALVTLDPATIGVMSCNPAIGGLAKGQLVREIDALGGLMPLAADAAGIMFRVLNTSRGPAVHGPRCQCDKHAYAETVRALLASRPEIEIVAGAAERFVVEGGRVAGLVLAPRDGGPMRTLRAPAIVLTTGTFMRGLMHTGERRTPGGRHGEGATSAVSRELERLGFELGRLKTGTPPRLARDSIDWDALEPQRGDDPPVPFSDLSASWPGETPAPAALGALAARFPVFEQVECRQTRTTPETHALVRANLHRAPMFSGQIEAVGPRYCPSLEDKVHRFPDRESHNVFLEPESLRTDWIYCNGISTSLPEDVQEAIVRGLPGCGRARVLRHGYAVEYDMVRPHQILPTGMTRLVEGLFLAGQINGTSGYEEAAAQGVVAGAGAARYALGLGELVLRRDQAYIGVLMDDLVTRTPTEPYRMFTSRAEHRLLLRSDNAADRLTPVAADAGLLDDDLGLGRARRALLERRQRQLAEVHRLIDLAATAEGRVVDLVRRPEFGADALRAAIGRPDLPAAALATALADRKYESYIVRQRAEIRRAMELETRRIPERVEFAALSHLRAEAREALAKFRPRTFGQAGRLEGVTPADLTLLAVLLARAAG